MCRAWLGAAVVALFAHAAVAVVPGEMLADPALETRAREIGKELRCLVCQNESIDASDAELARDLRRVVRERIRAGATDAEVLEYVVSRYGDFVLLKPPFKPATYALWLGPLVLAVVAGLAAVVFYRRRGSGRVEPALNAAEEDRLERLLAERQP
jgi:cytochrome c-type biogenesis protein CcmH